MNIVIVSLSMHRQTKNADHDYDIQQHAIIKISTSHYKPADEMKKISNVVTFMHYKRYS